MVLVGASSTCLGSHRHIRMYCATNHPIDLPNAKRRNTEDSQKIHSASGYTTACTQLDSSISSQATYMGCCCDHYCSNGSSLPCMSHITTSYTIKTEPTLRKPGNNHNSRPYKSPPLARLNALDCCLKRSTVPLPDIPSEVQASTCDLFLCYPCNPCHFHIICI